MINFFKGKNSVTNSAKTQPVENPLGCESEWEILTSEELSKITGGVVKVELDGDVIGAKMAACSASCLIQHADIYGGKLVNGVCVCGSE